MNRRMERHLRYASAAFDVAEADVLGPRRTAPVANARHLLCWLLRRDGLSFPHIGSLVGRDHTTVINSVRRVETDPVLSAKVPPLAVTRAVCKTCGALRRAV